METWVCAGLVLASNGDMGACWVFADQQWGHGCVCWVCADQQRKHGCVCWVVADYQWRHGHMLGGCRSAIETWVCAGWVWVSNGGIGVCWVVAEQQCVHAGCVLRNEARCACAMKGPDVLRGSP